MMNNLSYELSKQLKDIGFPQKDYGTMLVPPGRYDSIDISKLFVYSPTLEELIEACGDGFIWVMNFRNYSTLGEEGAKWGRARLKEYHNNLSEGDWIATHLLEPGFQGIQGHTPEEAVAKLYLALHETKP